MGDEEVHVPRWSKSGALVYMPVKYLFSLPAVAVKGGAVVASLLHQTHQALVHHLFLETAHERGESLDAERLGVRGRVLRRLQ